MNNKVEEFHHLHRHVIIVKPTIYDQVEEDKRRAIKRIMAIVDTQINGGNVHGHIRKAVLDSINDMARAFCLTLDRVVEKIEKADEIVGAPVVAKRSSRVEQIGSSQDIG